MSIGHVTCDRGRENRWEREVPQEPWVAGEDLPSIVPRPNVIPSARGYLMELTTECASHLLVGVWACVTLIVTHDSSGRETRIV